MVKRVHISRPVVAIMLAAAGLVAVVQMGVLEIHPWGSTVDRLETLVTTRLPQAGR